MSDDHSRPENSRSWLDRLTDAFSSAPDSKQDIVDLLRTACKREVLDQDTLSLMERALNVTEMQVREIMIPRPQMITISSEDNPEDWLPEILSSAHSRYPVIGDSLDEVEGILLVKDLLPLVLSNTLTRTKVLDVLRPAWFIPESKRLIQLLNEFKSNRNHMAIVVDEYGGVSGLVTIEDVLEEIVGDIEDEHDVEDEESMITPTAEGTWIVKALTEVEDFNEYFDSSLDEEEFDTIGGLVLKHFGRMPARGESVTFGGFQFTVLNADNRSVRLLEVRRVD
ncbi:transporter associated domain-containing protein [Hahella sp. SMD15-11]|uniref:Magnesium and cobalt efflux protein CorC n=1 Tax=Thermohahella caldifontis TaxID=3142973 RepID=A0AB39UXP7_9GAMM